MIKQEGTRIEIQAVSTLIGKVTVHGVQPQADLVEGNKRNNDTFPQDTPTNSNTQEDYKKLLSESNGYLSQRFTTRDYLSNSLEC